MRKLFYIILTCFIFTVGIHIGNNIRKPIDNEHIMIIHKHKEIQIHKDELYIYLEVADDMLNGSMSAKDNIDLMVEHYGIGIDKATEFVNIFD